MIPNPLGPLVSNNSGKGLSQKDTPLGLDAPSPGSNEAELKGGWTDREEAIRVDSMPNPCLTLCTALTALAPSRIGDSVHVPLNAWLYVPRSIYEDEYQNNRAKASKLDWAGNLVVKICVLLLAGEKRARACALPPSNVGPPVEPPRRPTLSIELQSHKI
jgi:hypothetical protein